MFFDKVFKIHKACSTDPLRPALSQVLFTGKRLIACSGYILAMFKPEGIQPDETPGLINPEAVQFALKGSKREKAYIHKNDKIKASENFGTKPCIEYDTPAELEKHYPPLMKIIKKPLKAIHNPVLTVGLNAKLLHNLADALGSDDGVVYLHFGPEGFKENKSFESAIGVTPKKQGRDTSDAKGIIMPCKA